MKEISRRRRLAPSALVGVVVLLWGTSPALAQFVQSEFRAADGTAYQVLRLLLMPSDGAEMHRITSIGGSTTGVGSCNGPAGSAGQVASAVVCELPPNQMLHSFATTVRSGILVPNSVSAIGL